MAEAGTHFPLLSVHSWVWLQKGDTSLATHLQVSSQSPSPSTTMPPAGTGSSSPMHFPLFAKHSFVGEQPEVVIFFATHLQVSLQSPSPSTTMAPAGTGSSSP